MIFQFGQPLQWYFTSGRGGGGRRGNRSSPTILRKRKQNLTVERIEEVFCGGGASSTGGAGDRSDVVAYFIASADCTSRVRRRGDVGEGAIFAGGGGGRRAGGSVALGVERDDDGTDGVSCDIEYFDRDGLRELDPAGGIPTPPSPLMGG